MIEPSSLGMVDWFGGVLLFLAVFVLVGIIVRMWRDQ